jgi:hypothetical protein
MLPGLIHFARAWPQSGLRCCGSESRAGSHSLTLARSRCSLCLPGAHKFMAAQGCKVGSVSFRSVLITIVIAVAVLFAVNHSAKLKAVVGQS